MRAVCRGAGRPAGRRRRQLLRARRTLAAGDAADQPDPRGAGCRGGDPQPVRGAERGGAGAAAVVGGEASRAPLTALPRPAEIPLSYAQRRLWFLDRLEGASGTDVIPLAVRLTGALDRAALEAALGDLVGGTRACGRCSRTGSGCRGSDPVPPRRGPRLESSGREAGDETGLAAALTAAASRGFDLAREMPLRAHLFELPRASLATTSMCC